MKKILLPASIVAMLGASMASAYDLSINGEVQDGFEGASFTFDGGVLALTGTGDLNSGEPVDPVDPVDPVEPVEPVDPVEPVEPVDPDTDLCDDLPSDSDIVCGEPIPNNALATEQNDITVITVPKGKTLASPFLASGSAKASGEFHWVSRDPYLPVKAWISSTPGGPELSRRCKLPKFGFASYGISYTYDSNNTRVCILTRGERYFLNVAYDASDPKASYGPGELTRKVLTSEI